MPIEVGDRLPELDLPLITPLGTERVSTTELFGHGLHVLFAVPGAFTPTCSDEHLPAFLVRADDLRTAGVDRIVCTAVNDHWVLAAWARERQAGERLLFLADGNGELAEALGLAYDAGRYGLGRRSRRYAMLIEDGAVRYLGVEPGPGVTVSGAEAVLGALRQRESQIS